jgi:hypothetical protein
MEKMVEPQNKSISNEEEIQVKMKMVKYYFVGENGMVIVYRVQPPDDEVLNEFYLVTFDDSTSENAWGIGYDEEEALKDAERKWDLESETEEEKQENPFRQVLVGE